LGSEQSGADALTRSEQSSVLHVADSAEIESRVELPSIEQLVAANAVTGPTSPLTASNMGDLPLASHGASKPWPRSPLIGREDAALEGYLVRHNGLMAEDGIDGMLPYVDVVTQGRVDSRPAKEAANR
jgi:hypothetical protein